MVMLVSLEQAKAHIRDDDADGDGDADLELKIKAASRVVMNYLKPAGCADFTDSNGDVEKDSAGVALGVPEDIQSATLLMLGYLFKQRDNDVEQEFQTGFLPRPVTALLYFYRDPTLQ